MKKLRFIIPRFENISLVVLHYNNVSLTVRQMTTIMLCVIVCFNIFSHLPGWALILRVLVSVVPVLIVLPFGWVTVAGRTLDAWLLVILRYQFQPKLHIWQQRTRDEK